MFQQQRGRRKNCLEYHLGLYTKIIAIMYIGCAKMQFFRYKHTNNLIFWYLKLKNENVLWWADTTRPLEGGRRRERERGARKAR